MKIRTDFVTNSSSSSFVIEITVYTVNGKTISFSTIGCEGEGTYVELRVSPKQMGSAESIESMIELLHNEGTSDDFWDTHSAFEDELFEGNGTDAEQFFCALSQLQSMDEIDKIAVVGYEHGWYDDDFHQTYIYDKTTGHYTGIIKGEPNSNGRAGCLEFSDEDKCQMSDGVKADICNEVLYPHSEEQPSWIKDHIFVLTGFEYEKETEYTKMITRAGGIVKSSTVLKTNYLIYNPDYDSETVKLKRAKELIEKGKHISIITGDEFESMFVE